MLAPAVEGTAGCELGTETGMEFARYPNIHVYLEDASTTTIELCIFLSSC